MKRSSGVLMHISSLWGDYSSGSLGKSAFEFVDFLCDCGFSYWQVLPLCKPDVCASPYKSEGAFSLNMFFVDLDLLYADGYLTKDELDTAKQKTPFLCEFERLTNERFKLLKTAAKRFYKTQNLDDFLKQNPEISAFCEYMARKSANDGKEWNLWTNDTFDKEVFDTYAFIHFEFLKQWESLRLYANKKGIKIIGDVPIYVSYDSADVWKNPSDFCLDKDFLPREVAGVPPDYFSQDGQLWGNPLYNYSAMKKDGYSFWARRMKFMEKLFDGVRIDHFRGFESYFAIPATDENARRGKWKKGPGMHLVKAIKESFDGLIIAEDLGDITDDVRSLLEKSGFPGMRVFQFAFLGDKNSPHLPHNYINNSVAYTGTHDNNTLLGHIWECDANTRKRVLNYCGYEQKDDNDIDGGYDKIFETMFKSSAGLVIFPIQDLLLYGSDTRLNTPGTATGNWRVRFTKEQILGIDKNKFLKYNELYSRI